MNHNNKIILMIVIQCYNLVSKTPMETTVICVIKSGVYLDKKNLDKSSGLYFLRHLFVDNFFG